MASMLVFLATVLSTALLAFSSAAYYCENSDVSTIQGVPVSFRIIKSSRISEEPSLVPDFEIDIAKYHVWGSAVLHYCRQHAVVDCFEIYDACKLNIQSMGGNVYMDSLKHPPTQHVASDHEPQRTNRLNIVDQKVAIIGANGYVGSYLHKYLLPFHNVVGYDRFEIPQNLSQPVLLHSSNDISDEELHRYDVVVYLGGFTGLKKCQAHSAAEVFRENIWSPFDLACRMRSSQLLLFSSTAAVSEGSGPRKHREDSGIAIRLLDKYSNSMYEREVILDQLSVSHFSLSCQEAPRMVGLRFGSVTGFSRSQRISLAFIAMLRSAYTSGYIRVVHPQVYRAILGLNDFGRALKTIIQDKALLKNGFDIFNLNSFNCNIKAIAVEISSIVGVPLITANVTSSSKGFSLDSTKMINLFSFHFHDTPQSVVKVLLDHFPLSLAVVAPGNKSLHPHTNSDSVPCQVCGNQNLQQVLDLHHQPLANSFALTVEDAYTAERYPLKLMRCPSCNHVQLSHIVDRNKLFQNYLYQSNTSSTALQYFEWLTNKIIYESSVDPMEKGTVIEIACNDGSQLDSFRARGWRTVGVDPAKNLIPYARSKGHEVFEGFWGSESFDMNQLPPPAQVNAIVAQNVLAHVDSPVKFLRACAAAMGPQTKLYIQTSQCEMINAGQFDTVYHEHVSFFSAHSFFEAAQLAGLHVSSFEETSVHGISCFVTFELPSETKTVQQPGVSVVKRIEAELSAGIKTEVFYNRFESKAQQLKLWIVKHLSLFAANGYLIGGYGAAAKGIVMLNYIQKAHLFSFVVDDAPLKNGLYCPGTKIPVWNSTQLASLRDSKEPLVLVIFAWNIWKEISLKIQLVFQGSKKNIICIVPFPVPVVIKLRPLPTPSAISTSSNLNILASLPKNVFSLSHHSQPKLVLIMHFYNAELLLPSWIANHAPFFDEVILIDYHSTDQSLSVIRRTAPSSWRVVASRNRQQDIINNSLVTEELLWYTKLNPHAWTITLEVSEFLLSTSLRNMLLSMRQNNTLNEFYIPKLYAVKRQDITVSKHDISLLYEHSTVGILSPKSIVLENFMDNFSIPSSILEVYEATLASTPSRRTIGIGPSAANAGGHEMALQGVFIIDYVWQTFDVDNGQQYCPLTNKLNAGSIHAHVVGECSCYCSWYPAHLLDGVDLSDIHSSRNTNNVINAALTPFMKIYQDHMFAARLEYS